VSQSPTEQAADGTAGSARQPARRFSRANVSLPVQYTLSDSSERHDGLIINLGGGGLRVSTELDLARGQLVTLHFNLPNVANLINARAKVVLSFFEGSTSKYAHGLAFSQISNEDQNHIVAYVESIAHVDADL
jgi:c-di-GMP-binding flagellar brake protein YcgR